MQTKTKNFGTWQLIRTRMESTRPSVACLHTKDEVIEVGYKNTFSLFVMLGVGILVATTYLLLEKSYREISSRMGLDAPGVSWNLLDMEKGPKPPTQNKMKTRRLSRTWSKRSFKKRTRGFDLIFKSKL